MRNRYLMKLLVLLACFIYVLLANWLALLAGPEINFTLFYLIPIAVAAWFSGIYGGAVIGLLSSFSWLGMVLGQQQYLLMNGTAIMNIFLKFALFMSYALLVARFKVVLDREKAISRVDSLTGLSNRK
jgi:hypothetical protein